MTNDNLLTKSLFRGVKVYQLKKQHNIGNGGNRRFLSTLMYVVEARGQKSEKRVNTRLEKKITWLRYMQIHVTRFLTGWST